jgi:hypothetical protein
MHRLPRGPSKRIKVLLNLFDLVMRVYSTVNAGGSERFECPIKQSAVTDRAEWFGSQQG